MSERDLTLPLRGALASLSAGAAALHLAIAPTHFAMHWTMGAGFVLTGIAQLVWAALLWNRPPRWVIVGGAVGQGLLVPLYLVVHMVGWPFGVDRWQPEAHTFAGVLCCLLELACAVGVMATAPWQAPTFRVPAPGMVIPVVGVLVVGLTSGTVALGGTTEHHTHSAAHAITAAGHAHGALDTTPPTPDQERAAAVLLERSHASMARFADVAVAKRAGYRVIHNIDDVVLHYGHLGYMGDGRTLDPDHMESLIYVHVAGRDLLVGGMYLMPIGETGPAIGGSLTRWHAHDDLCLDPVKILALAQTSKGCPPGSVVRKTGEMLHVWAIAYPGGPFADLDATRLRTAVKQYYGIGDPE